MRKCSGGSDCYFGLSCLPSYLVHEKLGKSTTSFTQTFLKPHPKSKACMFWKFSTVFLFIDVYFSHPSDSGQTLT